MLQCILLSGEREERPAPNALQLHVGPVARHGIHNHAHTAVLVCQEAGSKSADDEDPSGEDVGSLPVALHHGVDDLEGLHGHAVVVEQLAERNQSGGAVQLDLRIVREEVHGLEEALHSLEGPELVQAPAEHHDARPVDRHLPRPQEDLLEHLAAKCLDLLVPREVPQRGDEVRRRLFLDGSVSASDIVLHAVGEDVEALLGDVPVGLEAVHHHDYALDHLVQSEPQAEVHVLHRLLHQSLEAARENLGFGERLLQFFQQVLGRQPRELLLLREQLPIWFLIEIQDLQPHG
mmetsp:Transcript_93132/g.259415  ORF Transcript_93132/g.259415 Transcript_93132/m.259415 type:complete len:291 (+) Transcript_93132:932-1804(+)